MPSWPFCYRLTVKTGTLVERPLLAQSGRSPSPYSTARAFEEKSRIKFRPQAPHSAMKFKKLLYAIRKSIERGDFAAIEVDVALVDFLPEKIQLGIEFVFLDVDMP